MPKIALVTDSTTAMPPEMAQGIEYEFLAAGHLPGRIDKLNTLCAPRLDAILAAG